MTRLLFNRKIRCGALIGLVLTAVFSTRLAAAPGATKPDCSNPSDYAELVYCFLAQFRCLPSYFGIDGTPDYPKALSCFESYKLWNFAALMYINGEGTPRDLQKAAAALRAWQQQGPSEFNPEQAAALKKANDRCGRHSQSCSRMDFCKQLSEDTQEIEICEAVDQLSGEAVLSRAIAATRSKLGPADRVLFDNTVAQFKAYQLDDMQRQYQAFIDASLRDVAGASRAAFVRENFVRLMADTIQARNLKPATTRSYNALQTKLDREQASDLNKTIEVWQENLHDTRKKEWWEQDRSYLADYEKAARESQSQWVKLRDACAKLASSLYTGQAKQVDPALSMKAALTRLRIVELRYDPLAPEPNWKAAIDSRCARE